MYIYIHIYVYTYIYMYTYSDSGGLPIIATPQRSLPRDTSLSKNWQSSLPPHFLSRCNLIFWKLTIIVVTSCALQSIFLKGCHFIFWIVATLFLKLFSENRQYTPARLCFWIWWLNIVWSLGSSYIYICMYIYVYYIYIYV